MTVQPWGRTGRVTLAGFSGRGVQGADLDVLVDGRVLGDLWQYAAGPVEGHWFGRLTMDQPELWHNGPDLPSLDHAVMWVLRRAAPDVWRAERPVVWRVLPPAGACRNLGHWRVMSVTGSSPTFCLHGHARALAAADRHARTEAGWPAR